MGHVNNAAYWAAVEQRLSEVRSTSAGRCARASTTATRSTSASGSSSRRQPQDGRYGAAFVVAGAVKAVARVGGCSTS